MLWSLFWCWIYVASRTSKFVNRMFKTTICIAAGPKRKRTDNGLPEVGEEQNKVTPKKEAITAKPLNEARGHTGYLTVARRIVREVQELEEVQQEPEAEFAEENQT